jgi:hypothetical protein
MSLAGIYNITADRGATFTRTITLLEQNGTPQNLTGYTAKMDVRETYDSNAVALQLSTTNNRITIDGTNGKISLNVAADNMALAPFQYVYDLEVTSSAGVVDRVVMGTFTVRPEVTR